MKIELTREEAMSVRNVISILVDLHDPDNPIEGGSWVGEIIAMFDKKIEEYDQQEKIDRGLAMVREDKGSPNIVLSSDPKMESKLHNYFAEKSLK